jgi:PAS domain S-box-containing protein
MSDPTKTGVQNCVPEAQSTGAVPPDFSAEDKAIQELAAAFLRNFSAARPMTSRRQQAEPGSTLDEESLPSIEARYRVLVEQIPAVVFMAFLSGGVSEAYVSPHIEQMLGFTQEEWLDDPVRWYRQIHPEDRARWSIEAAETFITGKPLKSVYRVMARDGRVVWFHCEAKLVRKKNGDPWFIHGVGFDVTELKNTEQALQREIAERERLQKLELERHIAKAEQTESRLAAIVEFSDDAIIGKSLDGTITSWNAAATRLFGYEPAEILGKSILVVVPPELHGEETYILQKLSAGEHIAHRETQRMTKSGTRVDVSLTISPIRDIAGRVTGGSTIARDITQRKQSEEALRESEERFRTMAETAADGIFRIDSQSKILFANRAAEQIFGYTVEEMVGHNLTILMPEYLREVHRAAVERYLQTGVRHLDWERVEVTGLRKDGREIALELSLGESVKDTRRLFTGFVRDVTERKQMEAKLRITEKLAATGRLAATISHEINNPLEAVTNFIYLARHDPSLSPQARKMLDDADRELQRVAHIARQTLGFYRDTTSPVDVNVADMLMEIIELYRGKLAYKHLRVDTRFDVTCRIRAFQGEIRQVFSNVLANAIEASSENGRLVLRAGAGRAWANPSEIGVRVTIADQGRGIPTHAREKIFEPFYSTKQNIGTGLGLWVSKSLVEKHRGSMRFRSRVAPGRSGTVFSIFLPCNPEPAISLRAA